jgi:hypothetical protein
MITMTTTDITNSSALQLYHTAYRTHYESGDIKEACRLYREIIRNFPDSNECAYSVIQLEKIGAAEALKMLDAAPWRKTVPLAAIIISVLSLIIAAAALFAALDKKAVSWYNREMPIYVLSDEANVSIDASGETGGKHSMSRFHI